MLKEGMVKHSPSSGSASKGMKPVSKPFGLRLILMSALCLFFFVLFANLGIWQVHRLAWKTNLIAMVKERVHQPPVLAPQQKDWPNITLEKYAYLPVYVSGHYLNDKEILVTAMADDTSGYFVMTPFMRNDHTILFINRGFVPMDKADPKTRIVGNIEGQTTVKGLLRLSEAAGYLLRKNNPAQNKWFNRTVAQMAQVEHLSPVAPYFIDADSTPNKGGWPLGGQTKVQFYNAHLSYIITWFTLAAGVLGAWLFILRDALKKNNKILRPKV